MDALGYVRVSTVEQAESANGLDAQRRQIRMECERREWRLADVLSDEGATGRHMDRPGLREAFWRLSEGQASILVASRLDRLSRSVADFARVHDWCDRLGVSLVALELGVDTSTSAGRLVASVFSAVGAWEADVISARTRDGLASVRARGEAISRPAVADDPVLRERILAMRSNGLSFGRIAARLNAESIPTLRGGSEWRASAVRNVCGYRRPKAARPEVELPGRRR